MCCSSSTDVDQAKTNHNQQQTHPVAVNPSTNQYEIMKNKTLFQFLCAFIFVVYADGGETSWNGRNIFEIHTAERKTKTTSNHLHMVRDASYSCVEMPI